jgi:probable HAF family extracellular repeat protein
MHNTSSFQLRNVSRFRPVLVLMAALLVLAPASPGAQHAFTALDITFASGRGALFGCAATSITDDGAIVGACNDADQASASRGFLYDGRRFTEIYFPTVRGSAAILARSIYQNAPFADFHPRLPTVSGGVIPQDMNIHGQVTGWYGQAAGLQSFLKDRGSVSTITVPDSILTEAIGINDAGHIVGDYRSADGVFHGFLFANGVFTSFGDDLGATDINNAGQIVGCYDTCTRGFLLSGSTFTPVDVPGAVVTAPHGINDAGDIVGSYFDGTTLRGFLYDGVTFTTIDAPGAVITSVFRINNSGDVVGYYVTEPSPGLFEHHAFVARP